ncbi:N(6)-adenine-specific methyltransferase METTL4 isoform X2 [Petromyzon marinus]|uniref:N(6)-adenine-specific DNA methyltransferase METTL4 isoform X3 n=1 Tax=Petromyzon marinus TaxID=7757 RepID=A0AAJ7TYX0_PETMA|nr:N(6)-adenine-specific DNA methyltransferase METTL4 isoform X3 [Petromyzon marinus]
MHVQQQHSCCVDAVALHSDGRRECLMHKWEIENSAGRLKTQPRVCGDCALLLRVVVRPLMQMQSNGYTFTFRWSREQTAASGESGGIRTGQKKTKHPYPVTAADSAMSIVAESEFGWLLDHLAHVNSAVESTAEADSLASGLRFNAQYFHQPRPHIAAGASADTVECGERQVEDGGDGTLALLGSTAKRKRKRKRNDMNQGEIDALAYHQTIRDFVLEGSRNLVDLGRQRNLLLPRTLIPGPVEPPSPRRHCPGTDYVPAEEHEPRHGTQRNHRLAPAAETPNVKESGGAAAPSSRAGCRDVCCRACRDGAVAAEPDPLAELCDADEAVGRGRLPERASDVLVLEDTGAGTTELTAKTAVGRVVENRRRGPSVVDFNGHEYVLPPRWDVRFDRFGPALGKQVGQEEQKVPCAARVADRAAAGAGVGISGLPRPHLGHQPPEAPAVRQAGAVPVVARERRRGVALGQGDEPRGVRLPAGLAAQEAVRDAGAGTGRSDARHGAVLANPQKPV